MIDRCAIILLFLVCLLLNPAVGRAQVNRRLAMDYLKLGATELEAGDLDAALAHFQRAIELDPNLALLTSVVVWCASGSRIMTELSATSHAQSH